MGELLTELKRALVIFGTLAIILGLIYPLAITGISQIAFPYQANGEMIKINGNIVGSELIGQNFNGSQYFQSRPSAIDYNASTSGGSNYGPTNKLLINRVNETINEIKVNDSLPANTIIPSDMVLASGSGLDRYISVESALLQVPRIAKARNINESSIDDLIKNTQETPFPWVGQPVVNVLKLNLALNGIH
ncbi:MAG: potassium-transporting ATPase subunit KdpC [Methanobacterium sp.]|uniref:potassium-transporting ATPase subunit KdpC n=1 Tax=Methanobacterium sp. TaxID=2164 RepID=UPI003C748D49